MKEISIKDKTIFITQTVLDIFYKYRQVKKDDNEKGGIVLGQVNQTGDKILICRASIPGNTDKRGRAYFERNKETAQQIIEYEFYNSEKMNTYLGEWHTHPSAKASPSSQDINMIIEQFEINDIQVDHIIFFIVAQKELLLGLYDDYKINSVAIPF